MAYLIPADAEKPGGHRIKSGKYIKAKDRENCLDDYGIVYEITEHKAVFNMDELEDVELPYPEADAENLFVRDDRKKQYYLITVKGDKCVDLKEFRKANNTRPLTFASSEDLIAILKLLQTAIS